MSYLNTRYLYIIIQVEREKHNDICIKNKYFLYFCVDSLLRLVLLNRYESSIKKQSCFISMNVICIFTFYTVQYSEMIFYKQKRLEVERDKYQTPFRPSGFVSSPTKESAFSLLGAGALPARVEVYCLSFSTLCLGSLGDALCIR